MYSLKNIFSNFIFIITEYFMSVFLYVNFSSKGLKPAQGLEGRSRHLGANTQLAAFCNI